MTVVRIGGDDALWSADDPATEAAEPADRRAPPLVEVTWRDAWFEFEEPAADEARSDYLVTTVGFLVADGPRFLSIAQEILPDDDGFRAITHIPLSVVRSVTGLAVERHDQEPGQAVP